MDELVNEMTHVNPAMRPPIEEVVDRLAQIRQSLNAYKLRSIIKSKQERRVFAVYRRAKQAILYNFSNRPAIPEPYDDQTLMGTAGAAG
jgi:hypothetical protein